MPMINMGKIPEGAMNEHLLQKIGWQMANLPLETANAFANWYLTYASAFPEEMEEMRELLALCPGRIQDASKMEKKSGPILVVGSGSSLNQCMPRIKEWKGAIICSTSQASTFVKYGRPPDYVACLDPRDASQTSNVDELAAPDWGDAVMVGHVSIPPAYVNRWLKRARGTLYVGRIMEPTYEWYSHHLGRGYPWIRNIMLPMIDSGASEIGLATWLGYSPIYLVGIDYGGPRFDRYDWHYDTNEWTYDGETSKVDMAAMSEQLSMTMSYASRGSLMSAFLQMANEKYKQRIYSLSKWSALTQFPKKDWEAVLAEEPEGEYDAQKVMDEIEMALAIWDTFLVPLQGGFGVDYMTYLTKTEDMLYASLAQYNAELIDNLRYFAEVEKQQGKLIPEMMASGQITLEHGDLLTHGAEEFRDWDWHKIRPVDILMMCMKRRWLLEQAKKRGYKRGAIPMPTEARAQDFIEPEIRQIIKMNQQAQGTETAVPAGELIIHIARKLFERFKEGKLVVDEEFEVAMKQPNEEDRLRYLVKWITKEAVHA